MLAESFVGTAAAWVNLLLLSASGPIKSPAGACATSFESLDTRCDSIASGKTKFCLVGGHEAFATAFADEFGRMNATINSENDLRCGREPKEMSRPTTSTRYGFVGSEGCGIQILTTATLALQMGLPIYGVVASSNMAGDKLGRSIPAPGQGIKTNARQLSGTPPSLLLNPALRAARIRASLNYFRSREEMDLKALEEELEFRTARGEGICTKTTEMQIHEVKQACERERRTVLRAVGNEFWKDDPKISPLAGALAVWDLSVNDLTFASFYGTSTKLNDTNECETFNAQMQHLGRDPSNPVFTVFQKALTGHGLGAAGGWMMNGALQAMQSGVIPGNLNADNIDAQLQACNHLLFTNQNLSLRREDVKGFSVTSFGFGQKGAQVIVVHPRCLYGAISPGEYQVYWRKQMQRRRLAGRHWDQAMHGGRLFQPKDRTPYEGKESSYLPNPTARMQ